MKLPKHYQDELNVKGGFKIFAEALGLIIFLGSGYGLLLLLNAYAQTQGA